MHLKTKNLPGEFAYEVENIVGPVRLAQSDVIFMTPDDDRRQKAARVEREKLNKHFSSSRLLVPPTLVIESISPGHAARDRKVKRRWYAEAGVPNYWLFDANRKAIEALILKGERYRFDCRVQGHDQFRPSLFEGISIPMQSAWL